MPSWLDRTLNLRDRILASPKFQRWAAAFPLSRPIARREARALFDLCAGFVYSQVLLACVRVRLFEALREGPRSLEDLSNRLSLPLDATKRLLDAAVSLRLAARRSGGRYGLGMLGAALIANPGVLALIEHHALLYDDLRDPVALLRGNNGPTALGRYWAYATAEKPAALGADQVAAYSDLMAASQSLVSNEILDAYPLHRHRRLLDVGGGDGAFLAAAAARAPDLRLMLFDLPSVAERARAKFANLGLGDRATAAGGSFLSDPLPEGADIVSLVRVLLDHDDVSALTILRAARRALPDGGTILIAEPMGGTRGDEAMGAAYFGFYLLAMGRGRPRSVREHAVLLRQAGFSQVREIPTHSPLQTSLLVARTAQRNLA